jgi:hypothetical protein
MGTSTPVPKSSPRSILDKKALPEPFIILFVVLKSILHDPVVPVQDECKVVPKKNPGEINILIFFPYTN